MENHHPERAARLADRRLSRRRVLRHGGAGLAAGALATAGVTGAAAQDAPSPVADDLAAAIDAIMRDPRYSPARLGLHVADRATGEVVFDIRGDEWFLAASTTKLFSGAAALDAYGPDHRFETPLYWTGPIAIDGELQGHLVLVASGDPTMGGRDTPEGQIAFTPIDHINATAFPELVTLTPQDPLAGLDDLARQAVTAGIRRVSGEVIVNVARSLRRPWDDTASQLSPIVALDLVVGAGLGGTMLACSRPGYSTQTEAVPCRSAHREGDQTMYIGGGLLVLILIILLLVLLF